MDHPFHYIWKKAKDAIIGYHRQPIKSRKVLSRLLQRSYTVRLLGFLLAGGIEKYVSALLTDCVPTSNQSPGLPCSFMLRSCPNPGVNTTDLQSTE